MAARGRWKPPPSANAAEEGEGAKWRHPGRGLSQRPEQRASGRWRGQVGGGSWWGTAVSVSATSKGTRTHTCVCTLPNNTCVRECMRACMRAQSLRRAPLSATLWTVAHHAPLSMGILQARTLEWVVMPSSRGSSPARDRTCVFCVSCLAGGAGIKSYENLVFSTEKSVQCSLVT